LAPEAVLVAEIKTATFSAKKKKEAYANAWTAELTYKT
jgi:hypothetical protein